MMAASVRCPVENSLLYSTPSSQPLKEKGLPQMISLGLLIWPRSQATVLWVNSCAMTTTVCSARKLKRTTTR